MDIRILEKDEYQMLSEKLPIHIMQSYEWGEAKKPQWIPHRFGVFSDSRLVCLSTILIRPIPIIRKYIAYIPRGIAVIDKSFYSEILVLLKKAATELGAICLLIDPDTPFDVEINDSALFMKSLKKDLTKASFRRIDRTLQPMRTVVIDLSKKEDELLSDMRSKHRQYIRKATRNGIRIVEGTMSDFDVFYELLRKISSQKGYEIHTKEYHKRVYELFQKKGNSVLFLAKTRNKVIGAYMVFFYGNTAYEMYGGCPRMGKDLLGNYPLKWESIKYAKGKDLKFYDQWGAEHIYPGLVQFKEGFGGRIVEYLPQFGVSLKPFGILTYRILWKLNSFLRRLIKS